MCKAWKANGELAITLLLHISPALLTRKNEGLFGPLAFEYPYNRTKSVLSPKGSRVEEIVVGKEEWVFSGVEG